MESDSGQARSTDSPQANARGVDLTSQADVRSDRRPIAYVAMCADVFHEGHVNVLRKAAQYGNVVVGLLTDAAVASYKRVPLFSFEQRKAVVEAAVWVTRVIPQESLDFRPNLRLLRPEYVVHGDDWREGVQQLTRTQVIGVLGEWNGTLIEVPYTHGVSSTSAQRHLTRNGVLPARRLGMLRRSLAARPLVRALEAHTPLSALIVERAVLRTAGSVREFDALWASSLTDATSRGKPDSELIDLSARLQTINEIFDITTKPMIFDGNTGGVAEHFVFTVRALERLGVSAVVIEDKMGVKRNSLSNGRTPQVQAPSAAFAAKLAAGKEAQVSTDFMIVARIESLVLGVGPDDVIRRAREYVAAGADAVLIHSKSTTPDEVLDCARRFRRVDPDTPIIAVPSVYDTVDEERLADAGVNLVVYANQLLRASYLAMKGAAESILRHGRAYECSQACVSVQDLLSIVEGNS